MSNLGIVKFVTLMGLLISPLALSELLLVSTHEYGNIMEAPCIVYKLKKHESSLDKLLEVSVSQLGGIRQTSVTPDEQYIVIWQSLNPDENLGDKGRLLIVDLVKSTIQTPLVFSFRTSLGGDILYDTTDGFSLLTPGFISKDPWILETTLLNLNSGESHVVSEEDRVWNNNLSRGLIYRPSGWGFNDSRTINYDVNLVEGYLVRRKNLVAYTHHFILNPKIVNSLSSFTPEKASIRCANTEIAVYRFTSSDDENILPKSQNYIYHKGTDTWIHYTPPKGDSEPLLYGDYIVERVHDVVDRNSGDNIYHDMFPNGQHTFYNYNGEELFQWQSEDPNTVILNIFDGRIIYRSGISIKSSPINIDSGINIEEETLLIEDERLKRVYWALPDKTE